MEFNTLIDSYTYFRGIIPQVKDAKLTQDEFYQALALFSVEEKNGPRLNQCQVEHRWWMLKRPYYRIWPSVIPSLTKIDLSRVKCNMLRMPRELPSLALYFPKGHELDFPISRKVKSILVTEMGLHNEAVEHPNATFEENLLFYLKDPNNLKKGIVIYVDTYSPNAEFDYIKFCCDDLSVEEEITQMGAQDVFPQQVLKLVTTILLLDDNPTLITADVLSDDRVRYENGDDELKRRLEEKAKRRGKVGWDIGKILDEGRGISPHYRHPHFGIRWKGKGRTEPVLVPISGSFVHRDRIVNVPSGYEDDKEIS